MAKIMGKENSRHRGRRQSRAFKHALAALGFIAFAASVLRPTRMPTGQRVAHHRMSLFRYGKFVWLKVHRMWRVLSHGLVHLKARRARRVSEMSNEAIHRDR